LVETGGGGGAEKQMLTIPSFSWGGGVKQGVKQRGGALGCHPKVLNIGHILGVCEKGAESRARKWEGAQQWVGKRIVSRSRKLGKGGLAGGGSLGELKKVKKTRCLIFVVGGGVLEQKNEERNKNEKIPNTKKHQREKRRGGFLWKKRRKRNKKRKEQPSGFFPLTLGEERRHKGGL